MVGGAIAALAVVYLVRPDQGPDQGDAVAALRADLAAVDQRATDAATTAGGVAELATRLEAVEASAGSDDDLSARVDALEAAETGVDSALSARVDALEAAETGVDSALSARVDALEVVDVAGAVSAGMAPLAARVEALEAGAGGDLAATVAALTARIDTLDAGETSLSGDVGPRLEALEAANAAPDDASVAELRARVAALESGGGQAVVASTELSDRLAALEEKLVAQAAGDGGAEGSGAAGLAIVAVEGRLDGVEALVGELQGAVTTAAERLDGVTAGLTAAGDQTTQLGARLDQVAAQTTALADQATQLGDQSTQLASQTAQLADQSTQLAGQITQLSNQAMQLTDQTTQLSGVQTAGDERTTVVAGQVDGLAAQVGGLGDKLGLLEEQTTSLTGEVGTLGERLGATETRLEAATATEQRAAALALITAQLGTAVGQSQPFDDLLANLQSLGGDDQVVAFAHGLLVPSASSGAPSLADLRTALAGSAAEIVHESVAPEGQSMLDEATGSLMRLISVRPVGRQVEGDHAAARVARAEAALAEADLATAVAEIEQVDGPAAAVAAPWLADARRRLDAEAAVVSLRQHATELLSRAP